jgi:hypothetical protein
MGLSHLKIGFQNKIDERNLTSSSISFAVFFHNIEMERINIENGMRWDEIYSVCFRSCLLLLLLILPCMLSLQLLLIPPCMA